MSEIDNRVVGLKFNNRQFEEGVGQTMSTLDKLKRSLRFDGAAKGFGDLQKAGQQFTLDSIGRGVDAIGGKFSAMSLIGITALTNLVNKAVDAGTRMAKSLTIDPVKQGFQEYETQMNAVQTILANTSAKGTTLKDVTASLDELNSYADKTIYNFTQMTKNIGTFTAAGIDLKTSTSAIKGIANLAAVSGSTSEQASTAMYQLSQAMASGTVKLMDWNSVVNAGMGGQVFKDALTETARAKGIDVDGMIKKAGSFRESLKEGWLSTEVLTATLSKFTGDLNKDQIKSMGYTDQQAEKILKMGVMANDAATKVKTFTQLFDTLKEAAQSGWAKTWQIIIGDFEEAKGTLTLVSNALGGIISGSADARNKMLDIWKDLGGRDELIKGIKNAFEGVYAIIKTVGKAFRDIFPAMDGKRLYDLTVGFRELTENLKLSEGALAKVYDVAHGIFAVFHIAWLGVKALGGVFMEFADIVSPRGAPLIDMIVNAANWVTKLDKLLTAGDYTAIKEHFGPVYDAYETLSNKVRNLGSTAKEYLGIFVDAMRVVYVKVRGFLRGLTGSFDDVGKTDTSGADTLVKRVRDRLEPLRKLGNTIKNIFDAIGRGADRVRNFFKPLTDAISAQAKKLGDNIRNAFKDVDFNTGLDAVNTGFFGAFLIIIKRFTDKLSKIKLDGGLVSTIKEMLKGVTGTLEAMQAKLKADALLKIAGAMALLVASIVALSLINSADLTKALGAITVLFAELFGSVGLFEKVMAGTGFTSMIKVSTGMMFLGTSILILAGAVKILSTIDWEGLAKGLVGVGALMTGVVVSAKLLSGNSKHFLKGAFGLIAFAKGIQIMSDVVVALGGVNFLAMSQGLLGVGAVLGMLAVFMKTTSLDKVGLLKAAGLMVLAAAIDKIAGVVEEFAKLDPNELGQGIFAMGSLMAMVVAFTRTVGDPKGLIGTALGLNLIGVAMNIFAGAIEKLGELKPEVLGNGLFALGIALALVVTAMRVMPKNLFTTGAGMLAVSVGIKAVSDVISTLGELSWGDLGRGLVGLAGSLGVMIGAMYLMPSTLAGSAALMVMAGALVMLTPTLVIFSGMTWGEIAAGLGMLAGTFGVFGLAGMLLAPAVPVLLGLSGAFLLFGAGAAAAGAGMLLLGPGMAALGAGLFGLTKGFIDIVKELLSLIPRVVEVTRLTIDQLIKLLGENGPRLVEALSAVIRSLVKAVGDIGVEIVDAFHKILVRVSNLFAEDVPMLVDSGLEMVLGILKGVRDNLPRIINMAVDVLVAFVDSVSDNIWRVVNAGWNMIIDFINGMADSIRKNSKALSDAAWNLADAILDGLGNGLLGGINFVVDIAADLANRVIGGIKAIFGIQSPSKVMYFVGTNVTEGLRNGLNSGKSAVLVTAKSVGDEARVAMTKSMELIGYGSPNLNPTITPVIDLDEVRRGKGEMSNILSTGNTMTLTTTPRKARLDFEDSRKDMFWDTGSRDAYFEGTPRPKTIQFIQNNNSPKALSQVEIYRNTKNQLSMAQKVI